jgi:hypothetical protein
VARIRDGAGCDVCRAVTNDRPGTAHLTGNILAWRAGEYIAVAEGPRDPRGFKIGLRRNTVIEGSAQAGARVTVWYRTWRNVI